MSSIGSTSSNVARERLVEREDVRDRDAAELLERLLEELGALRQETARQTALLEAVLARLAALERTQYS